MWFVKTLVVEAADDAEAAALFVERLAGADNSAQLYASQIEGELTAQRLSNAHANAGRQFKEALKLRDKRGNDD